ncbi:RodZ domain-containing protein [Lamprocystis purpurea]|jgi:cytoskeleton protein RodZ|uniref:RodZ domain-containing protein n=1 Tax=Lamprocystis purpurea TaxID=61598 RepID=UPI00039B4C36|nr:RodZ domain-containing protein [Lamprocystis purpurea]
MNPVQAMSTDDQNVVEFAESPGRRLRVQRQARGLEVERVAAQLHLRVPMVEALEQDRYHDLPGPVFIAGYLRNYARLLGLDPEPLIMAYRASNPDPEPVELGFKPVPQQTIGHEITSAHVLMRLISVGVLAAVIAMVVLWWQNRAELIPVPTAADTAELPLAATANPSVGQPAAGVSLEMPTPDPTADTATAPPTAASAALSASGATAELALPTLPRADEPASLAPTLTDTTAAADAQGAAASPPAKPTEVSLTFSGPTWIKILDAGGAAVLSGTMRKGDTRVLAGTPPYTFNIGIARVAQVTVGGRPIDLERHTKGGRAKFKLDPSNPE